MKELGWNIPTHGGKPQDFGFIKELTDEERVKLYAGRSYRFTSPKLAGCAQKRIRRLFGGQFEKG